MPSFAMDKGNSSDGKDWRETATPSQLKAFDDMFGKGGTHHRDRSDVKALREQAAREDPQAKRDRKGR